MHKFHKHLINRYIKAPRVRVIWENFNDILSISQALDMAEENGMDLVQMGDGPVPTCKIMNYSKYLFDEKRKKKQQAVTRLDIKEMQIKPAISKNDAMMKQRQIMGFLEKGHEVRVRLKLRGREKANPDEHIAFLMIFVKEFEGQAKIESKSLGGENPINGLVVLKPIKKQPSKTDQSPQ